MKYVDEFRDKRLVRKLADNIRRENNSSRTYRFMEVCGTHTMAIFRFGLRKLLPENIKLISGPGCPVCVTPDDYIDRAIAIAALPGVVITTFGDMLRVPGSHSSLEKERSRGAEIKVVYSTDDAIKIAQDRPGKEIVFLGVGFETTAPTVAASIIAAKKKRIKNYSVLSAHKTMPAALEALVKSKTADIDGFLLPGHVSAITGTAPYRLIASKYRISSVVAGFEPVDILQAILMLMKHKTPAVEIQYKRIITPSGNPLARSTIEKVFKHTSGTWRGIGNIPGSGLAINNRFSRYDASAKFKIKVPKTRVEKACMCGEVLRGSIIPTECRLFASSCTPDHPRGACMVSSEGTCAAYYKYGKET